MAAQTLRRLAHASGAYQESLEQAREFGFLTPETEAWFEEWQYDEEPAVHPRTTTSPTTTRTGTGTGTPRQ